MCLIAKNGMQKGKHTQMLNDTSSLTAAPAKETTLDTTSFDTQKISKRRKITKHKVNLILHPEVLPPVLHGGSPPKSSCVKTTRILSNASIIYCQKMIQTTTHQSANQSFYLEKHWKKNSTHQQIYHFVYNKKLGKSFS